jgi:transposase
MRRVTCPEHGVVTEQVPWGDGKNTQTVEHRQFLANWARRLSWKETAECFNTTPGKVHRAVAWIVDCGLKNRDLSGVTKIGVDEIQRSKGHKYMTLVYQLDEDNKRLLGIEEGHEEKSLYCRTSITWHYSLVSFVKIFVTFVAKYRLYSGQTTFKPQGT